MVERAIASLPSNPIVIRLSGYSQSNDRLAIREIAWQLAQQTGQSFLSSDETDADETEAENADRDDVEPDVPTLDEHDADADADDDENPFVTLPDPSSASDAPKPIITLPPPAHLLALISMIPTLPRPTILVLEGFDLFAGHARQALLYCLLDTAQACRAGTGAGTGSGMAVVGVTSRVDTLNLLEKRVKSRFSGRMIRTACPARVQHWVALANAVLCAPLGSEDSVEAEGLEWRNLWEGATEKFVGNDSVMEALRETYSLTRDFQMFRRIMVRLPFYLLQHKLIMSEDVSYAGAYPRVTIPYAGQTRQRYQSPAMPSPLSSTA